jgi:ATP-dependent DNA ligase
MKIAPVFVIALAISPFLAGIAQSSRSAADQALYERAVKECNSWKYYPDGARVHINYKKGWFRCYTRHIRKRHSK